MSANINDLLEMKMLSVEEVGNLLSVSVKTVYELIKGGDLRAYKVGKFYRVRLQDLQLFLDNTKTKGE